MRIDLKTIEVFEAFDDREWGSSWGYFTTEEEAREEVKKNSGRFRTDKGTVRTQYIDIPRDYKFPGNN